VRASGVSAHRFYPKYFIGAALYRHTLCDAIPRVLTQTIFYLDVIAADMYDTNYEFGRGCSTPDVLKMHSVG